MTTSRSPGHLPRRRDGNLLPTIIMKSRMQTMERDIREGRSWRFPFPPTVSIQPPLREMAAVIKRHIYFTANKIIWLREGGGRQAGRQRKGVWEAGWQKKGKGEGEKVSKVGWLMHCSRIFPRMVRPSPAVSVLAILTVLSPCFMLFP